MIAACCLAFIAGATIESACVFWVHFSEREQALRTALCSMLIAIAQVTGFGEALLSNHRWIASAAYVLGFGVGTFTSVRVKAWLKKA